jgi:multicomponent Na+:H+ antiporter subunit D
VTAVFAGLLTKVGVYAVIRTQTLLFPGGGLDDVLMWAALGTMLVAILGAIAQTDVRRLLSFTLVSHIGYMVFGISLASAAGLAGAVFYVVHHIAIQTSLFLVAGLVERRSGTTSIDRLGGLAAASPLLATLYLVPALNLAGVPPLSGFLGKLGLLQAGVADGRPMALVLVGAGVVTSLLTLVAVSRVWTRAFWRPPSQEPATDTSAAAAAETGPDRGPERPPGEPGPGADQAERQPTGGRAPVATATGRPDEQADDDLELDDAPADGTADDGADGGADAVLPRALVATTSALVALTVALTVVAGPLYGLADRAAADLLDRGPYLSAVAAVSR